MKKETLRVYKDKCGTIRYSNSNGQLHNPDGPAVVYASGDKWYYINGKRHNPNGPAIVGANSYKAYFINGKELTKAGFNIWQAQQTAK
jgi:hypothetical protein